MSIRSFSLVDTIKKLVKGERSANRYEEIFSEKKLEQLYHFWQHIWEDVEVLEKIGIIEFYEKYEHIKWEEPEVIFKAWQQSIIWELKDIHNNIHLKIEADKNN